MTRHPFGVAVIGFAALLVIASLVSGTAGVARAATVTWAVDADGSWDDPSNWSGAAVPTLSDTVVIDRPSGLYTVTVPSGSHAAYSIHSNERLVLDAGTLTVAETLQVNSDFVLSGTTLVGAIVSPGADGEGVDGVSGALDGVTMNADMNISAAQARTVSVTNGLTLNGTVTMGDAGNYGRFLTNGTMTIDGSGEIVIGSSSASSGIALNGTAHLTIESGLTIHGGRGTIGTNVGGRMLTLRAPVTAEVSGQQITLYGDSLLIEAPVAAINGGNLQLDGPLAVRAKVSVSGGGTLQLSDSWANEDTLEVATGSTLDLNGTWTNLGAIRSDGGVVKLGGAFAWADVGDFVRVGGAVDVDGTMDNTGNALTLDGDTGTWRLNGGTLVGGSVETGLSGAELRYGGSSTLDGVVMNTDMNLSESYSLTVSLVNGFTLNGTATMGTVGNYGRFLTNGTMTLDGTGEIVLGNASVSNGIAVNGSSHLTIESGLTIHGGRGTIGTNVGGRMLTLRAPVTAEVSGQQITLYGDSLLIEAPVAAINGGNLQLDGPLAVRSKLSVFDGGTLQLTGSWANEDTLEAGSGCTLDLNGTWTNLGAIRSDDATVKLGGTFAWADVGDFVRVGGAVDVDGTMDNTGNALTLDGDTGTWRLNGGTLVGGSVETGLSGAELRYGGSSTLDGVVMNTDMNLSETYSLTVSLVNGFTLNGTATMGTVGNYGRFLTNGTMTLDGTGEIVLGNASVSNGIAVNGSSHLTIESGLTIHGGRGTIGTNVGGRMLTLRAPVTAEVSGQQITLFGDSLLVEAPVAAINGGSLQLDGPLAVRARASVTGGGTLQLTGGWANEDTLEAGSGCTLDLNGTWTNLGAIRSDDATVKLGGTFAWADVGDFVRVGGTVDVDGTMDNTGNALTLDGSTGTWRLNSGTLVGGSVETGLSGAELRYGGSSTLDGVVMNADMNLSESYSITVTLKNGLTLNGTATMGAAGHYGRFLLNETQGLDGTGEIVLGNASVSSGIALSTNAHLTIGSGLTIRGERGTIGTNVSGRTVTNHGTIRADSSGYSITLTGSDWTSDGTVIAALGTIDNDAPFLNSGTVRVDGLATWSGDGAVVQDAGATVIAAGGTFAQPLTLNGGILSGNGTITDALVVDGGTVAPGASPGLLSGTGAYAQSDGLLDVEIASADPAGYDRLDFGTTAALAGSLQVALLDGFLPAIGDTFELVHAPSVTGGYAPRILPAMIPSQRWEVDAAPDGYRLFVAFNPPPVALCHDTTLTAGPDCQATVSADALDDGTTEPNGDPFTRAVYPAGPYGVGVHMVNFVATDSLGAADTCVTTITVVNAPPVAAARDTVLTANASCEALVSAAALDDGTADPEGQPVTLALDPAGPYATGVNAVSFIATDACGAADTVQITVTVVNAPPAAAGRDTMLTAQSPAWTADVAAADLDDGTTDPEGQAISFALAPPGPYPLGEHVVDFIATDACGAADTVSVTISVVNHPPMAMCHDTTLVADLSCEAELAAGDLDAGSTEPDGHPLSFELVPPGPYGIGVHPVLFIATDGVDSDTCEATVTVIDNPPVAAARDTTVVGTPPSWTAAVSAADVDSFTTDPDGHAFTLALEPPGPYPLGPNQVSFIATDQCGAADTVQIIITVINTPPVAAGRDTTVLVVVDSCSVGMDAAALDDGSFDPEGQPLTFALDPPPPYALGVHAVGLIAFDDLGASDTTGVTITVYDTRPVAAAVPQLVLEGDTLTCAASAPDSAFNDGSSDADGHALSYAAVPPGPYAYGTTAVLFIASDGCLSDTVMTEVVVNCVLAGAADAALPLHFAVTPVTPNPFRATTRFRISLPDARYVSVQVFDIAGRRVTDLVDGRMEAGRRDVAWDGRRRDGSMAEAGVYLVRVRAGADVAIRRAIRVN